MNPNHNLSNISNQSGIFVFASDSSREKKVMCNSYFSYYDNLYRAKFNYGSDSQAGLYVAVGDSYDR